MAIDILVNATTATVTACGNTWWLTEPINGAAAADPKTDGASPKGAS